MPKHILLCLAFAISLCISCSGGGGTAAATSDLSSRLFDPDLVPSFLVEVIAARRTDDPTTFDLRAAARDNASPVASWEWDLGDGSTTTGPEVAVSYSGPGTYVVLATATTDAGERSSGAVAVQVFGRLGALQPGPLSTVGPDRPGDVDGDGVVTAADVDEIRAHHDSVRRLEGVALQNGDIDLDGFVTDNDADLLESAIDAGDELPRTLLSHHGLPGASVTLVSPTLLDHEAEFTIKIGGGSPFRPLRPALGFARFVIPLDAAGTVTIAILRDGVEAESFPFEIEDSTVPTTGTRIPQLLERLSEARGLLRPAMDDYFDAIGVNSEHKLVLLALVDHAVEQLNRRTSDAMTIYAELEDAAQDTIERAALANGLQSALANLDALLEPQLASSGDDALSLVCRAQNVIAALGGGVDVISKGCDVALVTSLGLLVVPATSLKGRIALSAWFKACASTELIREFLSEVGSLAGNLDPQVELHTTSVAPDPGEVVEIQVGLRVRGINELCALAGDEGANEFLDTLIKRAAGRVIKRSLALPGLAQVLRLALTKKQRENLYETLADRLADLGKDVAGIDELAALLHDAFLAVCDRVLPDIEGVALPIDPNGVLSGPVPAVGTLTLPPRGSGRPATYVCDATSSETRVTLTARLGVCEGRIAEDRVVITKSAVPRFVRTQNRYSWDHPDMAAACRAELGAGYRIAEWNDIVAYVNRHGIQAFYAEAGLTSYRSNGWVTRNGQPFFSSSRRYFVERHDGNVPSGWLVHTAIGNNLLDLGSWFNSRPILCYGPVDESE